MGMHALGDSFRSYGLEFHMQFGGDDTDDRSFQG